MVIGIVAGCIGLCSIICIGIGRQFFNRLRKALTNHKLLREILPPVIGGAMVGITNYCLPLTIGSGSTILKNFPSIYLNGDISNYTMIVSAFAKMALLSISMNCGFIGGFIYPMITIGTIAGLIAHNTHAEIPLGMAFSCFMAVCTRFLIV